MEFYALSVWIQSLVVLVAMPEHILTKHVSANFDATEDDSGLVKRSVPSTNFKKDITMHFQHGMRDLFVNGKRIEKVIPAFFATLTSGDIGPNYAGDAIKFNDVPINIGNSYNPNTGKFVAPIDGIYEINYSVMQKNGYNCHVALMKEGVIYSRVHAVHKTYDQLSKTVLISLKKDQSVWVRLVNGSTYALYGSGKYTTFSGHLIQ